MSYNDDTTIKNLTMEVRKNTRGSSLEKEEEKCEIPFMSKSLVDDPYINTFANEETYRLSNIIEEDDEGSFRADENVSSFIPDNNEENYAIKSDQSKQEKPSNDTSILRTVPSEHQDAGTVPNSTSVKDEYKPIIKRREYVISNQKLPTQKPTSEKETKRICSYNSDEDGSECVLEYVVSLLTKQHEHKLNSKMTYKNVTQSKKEATSPDFERFEEFIFEKQPIPFPKNDYNVDTLVDQDVNIINISSPGKTNVSSGSPDEDAEEKSTINQPLEKNNKQTGHDDSKDDIFTNQTVQVHTSDKENNNLEQLNNCDNRDLNDIPTRLTNIDASDLRTTGVSFYDNNHNNRSALETTSVEERSGNGKMTDVNVNRSDILKYYSCLETNLEKIRNEILMLKEDAFKDLVYISEILENESSLSLDTEDVDQLTFAEEKVYFDRDKSTALVTETSQSYITPSESLHTLVSHKNDLQTDLDEDRCDSADGGYTNHREIFSIKDLQNKLYIDEDKQVDHKRLVSGKLQGISKPISINNQSIDEQNQDDQISYITRRPSKSKKDFSTELGNINRCKAMRNNGFITKDKSAPYSKITLSKVLNMASKSALINEHNKLDSARVDSHTEAINQTRKNKHNLNNKKTNVIHSSDTNEDSGRHLVGKVTRIPSSRHFCGRLLNANKSAAQSSSSSRSSSLSSSYQSSNFNFKYVPKENLNLNIDIKEREASLCDDISSTSSSFQSKSEDSSSIKEKSDNASNHSQNQQTKQPNRASLNTTPNDSKLSRSRTTDNRFESPQSQQASVKKSDTDMKLFVSESFTPSPVNQLTRYKSEHFEQDKQDDELINNVISLNKTGNFPKAKLFTRIEDNAENPETPNKTLKQLNDKKHLKITLDNAHPLPGRQINSPRFIKETFL